MSTKIFDNLTPRVQEVCKKTNTDPDKIAAEGVYDLITFRCADCIKDLEEHNPYIYTDKTPIPVEKILCVNVDLADCENRSYENEDTSLIVSSILLHDVQKDEEQCTNREDN